MAARSASSRGHGRGQHDPHKPPSPLRKLFNFWCESCMNANDVANKERQRRKRDSRMLRHIYKSPTNRPLIPRAESDEEDSEAESFTHMWIWSLKRTIGTKLLEAHIITRCMVECKVVALHFTKHHLGTQGQGASSTMPHGDPYAPGGSGTIGSDPFGGFFGTVNPYVGMFPPPPPYAPPPPFDAPSQSQGLDDDDDE
ncbi:hypothetical protein C2845_PM09G15480 [Panicum miliaceum]|uniref:Uncharacterized protein n=1 Tax=Panicum miliaceum TaxID=4540 RepID=A0A3L6S5N5_PANMI|nr:hypothetical protein C2845_PM09G15480 [Panicum miliaceum]